MSLAMASYVSLIMEISGVLVSWICTENDTTRIIIFYIEVASIIFVEIEFLIEIVSVIVLTKGVRCVDVLIVIKYSSRVAFMWLKLWCRYAYLRASSFLC